MSNKLLSNLKASASIFESNEKSEYGLLAEFDNPGELLHAAEGVHKAGYRKFDTYSPFPIHGMDKAMGLGNSKVGWVCLLGGITGLSLATWLQWWTGEVDYPINISGKPFFAIEPSVPVMFELTVLFSAFAAVIGMLLMNGLPRPYNPLFYSDNFSRVTDDAFFLFIAVDDDKFDREKTEETLKKLGGKNFEMINDHGTATVGVESSGSPSTQEAEAVA